MNTVDITIACVVYIWDSAQNNEFRYDLLYKPIMIIYHVNASVRVHPHRISSVGLKLGLSIIHLDLEWYVQHVSFRNLYLVGYVCVSEFSYAFIRVFIYIAEIYDSKGKMTSYCHEEVENFPCQDCIIAYAV